LRKPAALLLLLAAVAVSASAQYYFDYPTYKRFELGLRGGAAFSRLQAETAYLDHWNDRLLTAVAETSNIAFLAKTGVQIGVHGAFFFNPTMGLRLEIGPLSSNVPVTTDFTFAWRWSDGRSYQAQKTWTGSGRTTTLPIALDFVWKRALGRHEGFLSGGVAYGRHSFRAESSFGYGISTLSGDGMQQFIDALKVGVRVSEFSWTSFGFNLGLGLSIKLSDPLRLQAEAAYFFFPRKKTNWTFIKGDYDGVLFTDIKGINFNDGDIALLTDGFPPKFETKLNLNRSFLRLALGIVLVLGTAEY
jgi:opacity protein-like surface antigen